MEDSRGFVVHQAASNRAGFRSDATTDGQLLGAAASKTVQVVASDGKIAVAQRTVITNNSGQTVALLIRVSRGAFDRKIVTEEGTGVKREVLRHLDVDTSANPLRLLTGESIELFERIVEIVETNSGGAAQTGMGVRYSFSLENNNRAS